MQPGSSSAEPRSYTEIEPRSQWIEGDEGGTLILDAKGFAREQMRVVINSRGSLKISGERPLEGGGNRWLRFSKNYPVPKSWIREGIQAKFDKEEGLLYVVLPKRAQLQGPRPLRGSEATTDGSQNEAKARQNADGRQELQEKIRGAIGLRRKKVIVASVIVMAVVVIVGIGSYLGWRLRK